jgi:rod shape determining protein RodA
MIGVERRLSAHLDWSLIGAVVALALVGLAMIYSVKPGGEFWTQVYALPVGLGALAACLVVDYRTLIQRSLWAFGAVVLALTYVHFFGAAHGGARRWISLGRVSLQPSEFARPALSLVLALVYGETRRSAKSIGGLLVGAVFVAVLCGLILTQPDLGTAATLIPVYLAVTTVSGMRLRWLAAGVVVVALLSPIIWAYGLHDYQKQRIETFLDPAKDPRVGGYQQIQARVTVGSGGLLGKGFRQGTQGGYGFLPAASNDFVFSVLAEEHGFLGVLVALGLYLFVIVRSLDAAQLAKDRAGACLVVAIISGFTFQVLYNITMSAGLAPVKGLTLPLMSYGGSSLVATLAGFGLILNVRMRRFTN